MLVVVLLLAALLGAPSLAAAQERAVFEGLPIRKVESSFLETREADLTADQAFEYQVRIVERNGVYYWASRGMRRMVRSEAGSYITYHAVDGTGYVRTGTPFMLDLRDKLPAGARRQEIGYVEHLLVQFASVTYYGNRRGAP